MIQGGFMKRIIPLAAGLAAVATFAAAEVAPENVAFDEYGSIALSLSDVAGDPAQGLLVMEDKGRGNCVACHVNSSSTAEFQGNVGPALDGAADRWDEAQLRGIVANAKMTFPDSVMPSFYKTSGYIRPGDAYTGKAGTEPLPPLLTAQDIEDVVAYLLTLKD
jgi:sulfur-oxidizing protein SoxX